MIFNKRTNAPERTNPNYKWGAATEGQCTWGVYYRCKEVGATPPCYHDRQNKVEGYRNAKNWPEEFKEPWEAHYVGNEPDYHPVAGDIIVFNGNYGHVAFIEEDLENDIYLISQWNKDSDGKYSSDKWKKGSIIYGKKVNTGKVKAYMHYPDNFILIPVDRNPLVDQIEVKTTSQHLRTNPSLNSQILGYAKPGYYYVVSVTEADDYTWYELSAGIYIAGVKNRVEFLPKEDNLDYKNLYLAAESKLQRISEILKEGKKDGE